MRLAREGLSTPTLWPGPGRVPGVPGVPGLAEGAAVAGRVAGGTADPGQVLGPVPSLAPLCRFPFISNWDPFLYSPPWSHRSNCCRSRSLSAGPSLHLVLPFACLSAPDHHALLDIACYRSLSLSHVQQLARSMGPGGNDFVLGYVFSTQSTAQYIAGTWSVLFE